ncbi:hypothetical protein Holit_01064 [Hollandina sp. SP2]
MHIRLVSYSAKDIDNDNEQKDDEDAQKENPAWGDDENIAGVMGINIVIYQSSRESQATAIS